MKKLFSLWFTPNNYRGCSNKYIDTVNQLLRSIVPPEFITRLPRDICEWKYWKAHEFKNFLLYYSIPIFGVIMKNKAQFEHHKLLVSAIILLSSPSISEGMINTASKLLKKYVRDFHTWYGDRHRTCNLHLLLHLPDNVRKFASLRNTSLFAFENLNGIFKNLVHGTRYTELQLCSVVSTFKNLTWLKSKVPETNSDVNKFCEKVELSSKRRRKLIKINISSYVIGIIKKISLRDDIREALLGQNIVLDNFCYIFYRLYKDKIVYDSKSYMRCRRTNSSTVKYELNGKILAEEIDSFVAVYQCSCHKHCWRCIENSLVFVLIKTFCVISPTIKTTVSNGQIRNISICREIPNQPLIEFLII